MAVGCSIAKELFQAIKLRHYSEYITKLHKQDIMSSKEFCESPLHAMYELDTSVCYIQRRINSNHMYDMFGDFSGTDAATVKASMLEIATNFDWYQSRGRVVLNFTNCNLVGWLKQHQHDKSTQADELSLYALSHMYDQHTVVLNKNRPWCTIRWMGDLNESDFLKSCQVHLLYIGINMFVPLKPRATPIPLHIQNYQKASDANWARLQEEHYTAYYMEMEYSDYVEVVGGKPGFSSSNQQHRHPVSSRATFASALLEASINENDSSQVTFTAPGQIVFPEPVITETDIEPRTSINASTSSNEGGTTIQPLDKDCNVRVPTSESQHVSQHQILTSTATLWPTPVQTHDNSQPAKVTNVPTNTVVINTNHVSDDSSSKGSSSNSSSSSSNDDDDPTTDNTDISVPELRCECFVSIKILDDRTIAKYRQKIADMKLLQSNLDSLMTLRTRPQSGLRCSSRTASKLISYKNMDTKSNEENDYKVQKTIKYGLQ